MISDHKTQGLLKQHFPFLLTADPRFLDEFYAHAAFARIEKDQPICMEGTSCASLALVLSGVARIYKLAENGKEITLYRINKGESCILTASCILSDTPFPANAICQSPVEAVVVSNTKVRQWLALYPEWRDYIFGLVASRLGNIISVVEEVAFKRMDSRIAHYLLDATANAGGAVLNTTHQAIASDLGTSREVVSRILKDLEQRHLIDVGRGKISVLKRLDLTRIATLR